MDAAEEYHKQSLGDHLDDLSEVLDEPDKCGNPSDGHFKLGALSQPVAIQDIESTRKHQDHAYTAFCHKFTNYLKVFLPLYGVQLPPFFNIPGNLPVCHMFFSIL
jgi:hypothetical protein